MYADTFAANGALDLLATPAAVLRVGLSPAAIAKRMDMIW